MGDQRSSHLSSSKASPHSLVPLHKAWAHTHTLSLSLSSHLSSSKASPHSLVALPEVLGVLGIVLQAQVVQAPLQVLRPQPCSFQAAALPAQQAHKACNTHCKLQIDAVPDGMWGSGFEGQVEEQFGGGNVMHGCIPARLAVHRNTKRSCTCHAVASLCKGLSGNPSLPALRKHVSPQQVKLSTLTMIPKQGAASPSSMRR